MLAHLFLQCAAPEINTATGRLGNMKAFIFLLVVFYPAGLFAQHWMLYVGPGITYDGFLRDKEVMPHVNKTSFEPGAGIVLGGGYSTEKGFNLFLESTASLLAIQYPMPGGDKNSSNYYSHFQLRVMAGSGPAFSLVEDEVLLIPYIQLGAAYMTEWDGAFGGSKGSGTGIRITKNAQKNLFMPLCGFGINYRFKAFLPVDLNVNVVYTPLNIYKDPVEYTATTAQGSQDMRLQGKLLQAMLTCRIHLPFNRKAGGNL